MNWIWWPLLLGLGGLTLLAAGGRHLFAGRIWSALRGLAAGGVLAGVAGASAVLSLALQNYWRMSYEKPLLEVGIRAIDPAEKRYAVTIRHLDGEQPPQICDVQGDEWLLSARVQTWKSWVGMFGANPTYTLDQVANKYVSALEANGKPITACALNAAQQPSAYVPPQWTAAMTSLALVEDRRFGSATYMPLADGAVYTLLMTTSGLNAEPTNDAARAANQPR